MLLARRHSRAHVLLYPVAVQGEAAASEVVDALAWFENNPCVDVLVVARGGGSLEDLAAFQQRGRGVRAIAASAIPMVSAIGHETDFTIADFVADLRAPMPSAAAEIIATDAQYRVGNNIWKRWHHAMELGGCRLPANARSADGFAQSECSRRICRCAAWPGSQRAAGRRATFSTGVILAENDARLAADQRVRWGAGAPDAARCFRRQMGCMGNICEHSIWACANAWNCLFRNAPGVAAVAPTTGSCALSPLAVLERGYALVYDGHDSLIKSSQSLDAGDLLRLRFAHGQAHAQVIDETPKRK